MKIQDPKKKQSLTARLYRAVLLLLCCMPLSAAASAGEQVEGGKANVSQSFTSSDGITWYVRGIEGKLKKSTLVSGTNVFAPGEGLRYSND